MDQQQTAKEPTDFELWAAAIYSHWKKYRDRILAMHALAELTCSREYFEGQFAKWVAVPRSGRLAVCAIFSSIPSRQDLRTEPAGARAAGLTDSAWDRAAQERE